MEVLLGPNPLDEPNLLYKLQRKIKVFNTNDLLSNRGYNLVASSIKYGIVFIGSPDGLLSVYYLAQLIDKECAPKHLTLNLQEKPTYISVSCDQELLAVTGGKLLAVYKLGDLQNQNPQPAYSIKLDVNPSTYISALQWNPCLPDTIAIAHFDGTLIVSQVSTLQLKKIQSKARCICWSPKGKQLVTGNSDGTLCQYKPDLTPAKLIPAPNLFNGAPVEALAIYWISTFQFAVVYRNASDNSRPAVTIVNTPKAGQPSCLNFEDVCYSMGSSRPWFYYLNSIAPWNIILSSSSNSMEIATLGSLDGASWLQWCQSDEARPELPLTDKKQENYPVGICIDTCAIHQLPWGENETLPHMPLLLVVSQSGLLTIFNIINLNKQAAQLCTPPQQLALPANIMTSNIPGEEPPQASQPVTQTPPPVYPQQVETPQQAPIVPASQPIQIPVAPTSHFGASLFAPKPNLPASVSQPFSIAPKAAEQKPAEPKPITVSQPIQGQQPPTAVQAPKPQPPEINAALKAAQEKANKIKLEQELKSMLIKEVNDFQLELHKFMVKVKNTQTKLQRDIDSINPSFNLEPIDTEMLRNECSMDELRTVIIQLKLELVRACAVVAEAKTQSEAKDYEHYSLADPLTTNRIASVKKLAYYVQTQLDQAHKALDHRWNEMSRLDPQYNMPGHRMIRPILDDVYQPLVKQQEILSRQQVVLRTLRNTLTECDVGPVFKSTSILRSTPFRNKDPLSKLTKNILNMSIEPESKGKQPLLSAQKLDALRDMLSNHKTVKIKPVNVELRQQMAAMRLNYQKSVKETDIKPEPVIEKPVAPPVQKVPVQITAPKVVKPEPKPDVVKPASQVINVPSFTGFGGVARTLFTDEPIPDPPKPFQLQTLQAKPEVPKVSQPQAKPEVSKMQPVISFGATSIANASNVKSVLKDLLQNKSQPIEPKNDANTFMGQPICSPTAFSATTAAKVTAAPSAVFPSKPIAGITDMFSQFQPQTFTAENKSQPTKPKLLSSETGEADVLTIKPLEIKKADKPSVFSVPKPPQQNVPDVIKSGPSAKQEKSVDKIAEKLKENVPHKVESIPVVEKAEKKEEAKPLTPLSTNKNGGTFSSKSQASFVSSTPVTVSSQTPKPVAIKTESKTEVSEKPAVTTSAASSLFAAANASSPVSKPSAFASPPSTPTTTKTSIFGSTPTPELKMPTPTSPPTSASSLFGSAVASQASTTSGSIFGSSPSKTAFSSSIFGSASATTSTTATTLSTATTTVASSTEKPISTPASPTSVFSPQSPIFGAPTTTSSSPSAASVFGAAVSSAPSVFASTQSVPTSTTQSVFGSTSPQSTSVFSATTTASIFAATTSQSIFATAQATTASSIFGTNTSTANVFGGTTPTTTSIFGSSGPLGTAATPPKPSIFGSPNSAASVFGSATSQAPVFGTQTTQASIFGGTQTTQASIFGETQTTQASVFGATPTTQASIFGATPTTQASVFGTTPTTQASVFGATPTTQASVFGTQPTQGSLFGSTPTTTQNGSLFGGAEANLFASASISTTSATSPTSGNIFGGSSGGSVFGGGNGSPFAAKSAFGQQPSNQNSIFFGSSTGFPPANNFWGDGGNNNNTTGKTGFGSGFGQPTTQSSIFSGNTGGSFSTPSAQPFGSAATQQNAPAFGGGAVFGSKPVFGQSSPGFGAPESPGSGFGGGFGGFNKSPSSGFGAPATFGGGATFGAAAFGGASPGKAFVSAGTGSPGGFGTPQQQSNATFENLASQNTLTFGNLAQQSGQPQAPAAPNFNTSPSFTGWRG